MHSTATPYVIMLDIHPDDGPALMTFTITGCVGMIGMNEHGVAVGINNLLGADGRIGVHWVYVVRKMLAQRTVTAALDVLRGAELSGAHNYLLLGPDASGAVSGYNVEQMATRAHVTPVANIFAHTNHCLIADMVAVERPCKAVSLASTHNRQQQASQFLGEQAGKITVETLMALTRYHDGAELSVCAHVQPTYDMESSARASWRPPQGSCGRSGAIRAIMSIRNCTLASEYRGETMAGNPFPGMNPWLEQPGLWSDVHFRLIGALARHLGSLLAPRYYVSIGAQTYVATTFANPPATRYRDAAIVRMVPSRQQEPPNGCQKRQPCHWRQSLWKCRPQTPSKRLILRLGQLALSR